MSAHRKKLAILLWSATPERPQLCATPFVHAAAAAAFDCEVEIHFAGPAVRLLVTGVRACAMAMGALVGADETLIPEFGGSIAASAFVNRALDPEWATLVF